MRTPIVSYADLAATLPEHVAAFKGVSPQDVRRAMATARDERNRRWTQAAPRTEAERARLYVELGELDLLKYAEWHAADREKQELHDELVTFARDRGLRVLDCGGGIGDTALAFAANGVRVAYLDFAGPCSQFARWRWRHYACAERVDVLPPEAFWNLPDQSFDMAVSIDVMEHLENPVRYATRCRELLRSGGHFFVTAFFEHSPRNPDHLPENDGYRRIFGGEKKTSRRSVLTNLGFRRKRWYWFVKP